MGDCKNCFNGCLETTSDQCVRYTGPAVPLLGIEEGQTYSLAAIETLITDYLLTVATGLGISPSVVSNCDAVTIPENATLTDILQVLIFNACVLDSRATSLELFNANLDAEYHVECISVDPGAGTHAVLDAVIAALCETMTNVTNILASLTQYVQISELNDYIAAYLAGVTSTKMYNKMVPYVAVEYYGALSNYPSVGDSFDINGVGQGAWEKVYICNGYNGITPDKRGFSPVGATENAGGGALNPKVAALTYVSGTVYGDATVVLTEATLPAHNHNVTVTDNGHTHFNVGYVGNAAGLSATNSINIQRNGLGDPDYGLQGIDTPADRGITSTGTSNLSASSSSKGGGEAHANIPPVLACHYIMYIP